MLKIDKFIRSNFPKKINWFKINYFYMEGNLINIISHGYPEDLSILLIYFKQGKWCKDCGNGYAYCECNYCKNCEFNYCLCDLNLKCAEEDVLYNEKERHLVRRFITLLCCKILSLKNNKNLRNKLEVSKKYYYLYLTPNKIIDTYIELLRKCK